jgi:predicted O-linked N-acetylglucosamine transferase (SPINDLY family)
MIKDIYKQEIDEILSLFKTKNFLNAKIKIENLIKTYPNDMFLENMYGVFQLNCNNLKDAIFVFNKLIKKYPNNAVAYYNLGLCYEKEKLYDEAREHLLFAIDLNNDYFEAFNVLGIVHAKTFQKDYAIKCLEKAFKINPNYIPTIKNLAEVYSSNSNPGKAIKIIENKIEIINDLPFAYEILGRSYCSLREHKKGLDFFEKSIELKFDIKVCIGYLFFSSYFKDFERKKYFDLALKLRHFLLNKNINLKFEYKVKEKLEENPLKIGFVANCFREHAVTFQILGVLNYLYNEKEVKLYAYNNNCYSDLFTEKLKKNFHFWIDIHTYTNQDALRLIREDNLDILIDLEGHSGGTRHELFINRAAPIQITWCGFLDSVGFPEMDYMIADSYVITKEQEKNYSEKIIYMPNVWSTLDTSLINLPLNKITEQINQKFILFGSPASPLKINNNVLLLWATILNKTQNTKIIFSNISYKDLDTKNSILSFLSNQQIDEQRIIFKIPASRDEFLKNLAEFDMVLDTFPYSGGTNNLESAWLEIPVLTMEGNNFLSRCGSSVNMNLGMKDWIAKNNDEYIEKAVLFSSNKKILSDYKKKLANEKSANKIFNNRLFAKDLLNIFKDLKYKKNYL